MYRDYYNLGAEPFRLIPDPAFVSAHQSYRRAQARMQHALEQGDGILVVTGRPGTGKTTLIANFLARLPPGKVLSATVVGTFLEGEDLLRMVGHAFGLDAKKMNKATLLCELQDYLAQQPRALLVIDEAQNLSVEALGEVHMLSNLHAGSRPLLQIFLVGQEQLHESLHTPQMQQLHQRVMAAAMLESLSLQETHDYVLHRLHCAGWRGNPAIVTDAFILIHRFSQGLPRYISKLCTRLLEHGARHHRNKLDLDDAVTIIGEMQSEQLRPLQCESHNGSVAPLPLMQDLVESRALPTAQRIELTVEEHAFLEGSPSVVQTTPDALVRAAQQASRSVITIETGPEETVDTDNADAGPNAAESHAPSPLRHAMERYREIGVQVLKSGAHLLGILLLRLLSGMRHLGTRSKALKPVAQTLWRAFRHHAARAWALLGYTVTVCRELLSGFVSGLGPRQIVAGGVALLLVVVGNYLLNVIRDDQRQRVGPVVADTQTASPEGVQAAIPELSVNAEEPALQTTTVPAAPAPPTQGSAGQQVARNEPAAAATAAAHTQSSHPDRSVAAAEVTPQKALTNAGEAETAAGRSTASAREKHVEELLALAGQAFARDRLRTPENKNAWHYYSQILVLEPGNLAAQDGMQQITARYHALAARVLRKRDFDKAEGFIQRGLSVVADDSSLLELQQEVERQRREMYTQQKQKALLALRESEPTSPPPTVDPQPKSGGLFGALKRVFNGKRESR